MRSSRSFYLSLWILLAANVRAANFSTDIAPVLLSECLTCHSAEKAKGGYRVHHFEAVLQAGKSKRAAVVPGKPEESELFRRLTTHDEDDRMPQDDDPLPAAQIELFREWIAQGAKLDRGEPQAGLALLVPKAPHPAPPDFYRSPLPILALAFTRDGAQLATGGYHEILFWKLEGGILGRVTNAPERIHSIAFDPNAAAEKRRFAIAGGKPGRSGEVSIYEDGALLTNLVAAPDVMLAVAFSPDGTLLAAGGADNAIRIFRTEKWEPVATVQQHADWVTSLKFSSANTKVLSASRDRTVRIYDAESGDLETTYPGHGAAVFAAEFLSDEMAISGGKEKTVHLWEIKDAKKQKEFSEAGSEINALLAIGDSFFAASADEKVRQYSTKDRKLVRTFSGNADSIYALAYNPRSEQLAAGTYRGVVKIWNAKDGSLEQSFVGAPLRPEKPVASNTKTADATPGRQ
jgi:WD40 repeat protein